MISYDNISLRVLLDIHFNLSWDMAENCHTDKYNQLWEELNELEEFIILNYERKIVNDQGESFV